MAEKIFEEIIDLKFSNFVNDIFIILSFILFIIYLFIIYLSLSCNENHMLRHIIVTLLKKINQSKNTMKASREKLYITVRGQQFECLLISHQK